jgi:SM-20-related protein
MQTQQPAIQLHESLDRKLIASVYKQAGRIHLRPIFSDESARAIHLSLATEIPWQLHLNDGKKPINLIGASFDELPEADRTRFMQGVYANAAKGFQYIFNSFPMSDVYQRGEHLSLYVMRLYEFLNSPQFLDFAREVTGEPSIAFADAQATRYRSGHFLSHHDDLVADKKRVAAYVLNFTPHWVADWGGILQFIAPDGHIAEGYTPTFNALNLFRVPQSHAVSYVAPFAQAGRLSITGWLRQAGSPI